MQSPDSLCLLDLLILIVLVAVACVSSCYGEQPVIVHDFKNDHPDTVRAVTTERPANEELFCSVFDYAGSMALVAPDGRWLRVNRALCAVLGYTARELLEKSFVDLTHPDDAGGALIQIQKILEGRATSHLAEQRIIH